METPASPAPARTRPHAHDCAEADRIVEEAIRGVGADVEALHVPPLLGVVLGGGYARGEGGVFFKSEANGRGAPVRLSNDLDFYVVADDDAKAADLAHIAAALRPVSEKWTAALGVDADFSPPKTPWRIRHDEERLMIQELVHGWCDVAGRPGEELFEDVARRPPEMLPLLEAIRLLVNRGAGLLLASSAAEKSQVASQKSQVGNSTPSTCDLRPATCDVGDFVARNVNKTILGCGDARLIARGSYRWKALERAAVLGDELYARAVQWKFRPQPDPPCDLGTARRVWLDACDELENLPWFEETNDRRSLRAAARWLVRRRSLGPDPVWTLGRDPLVRILDAMYVLVRDRKPFPPSLRRDWEIFN